MKAIKFLAALITFAAPAAMAEELTVPINGVEFEVHDNGTGDTVIVFESGFGTDASVWEPITADLDDDFRTITYSRAGLGKSSDPGAPRSIEQHLLDLSALLAALDVEGDAIFVGHSIGGLLVTDFAAEYPEKVSALVLVDPAVKAQRSIFKRADPDRAKADDEKLREIMPPAMLAQFELFSEEMEEAGSEVVPLPEDLPAVLLTSTIRHEEPFVYQETPEGAKLWLKIHNALFAEVREGTHIRVPDAGHNIHTEKPDLVIRAIRQIVPATE